MKYFAITLTLALILMMNTNAVKLIKSTNNTQGFGGNMYQFFKGFLEAGLGGANFDSCLPRSWRSATSPDQGVFENNVANYKHTWQKVLGYLGRAIDLFCSIRSAVAKFKDWLQKKEGKKRRMFLHKSGWGLWNRVRNTVRHVTNSIKDKFRHLSRRARNALTGPVTHAYEKFKQIRYGLNNFYHSSFFQKLKAAATCVKDLARAVYSIYKNALAIYVGINQKMAMIAAFPAGWVPFAINLVCAWKSFAQVIKYIIEGCRHYGYVRWNYFGKALGKLAHTIATF